MFVLQVLGMLKVLVVKTFIEQSVETLDEFRYLNIWSSEVLS